MLLYTDSMHLPGHHLDLLLDTYKTFWLLKCRLLIIGTFYSVRKAHVSSLFFYIQNWKSSECVSNVTQAQRWKMQIRSINYVAIWWMFWNDFWKWASMGNFFNKISVICEIYENYIVVLKFWHMFLQNWRWTWSSETWHFRNKILRLELKGHQQTEHCLKEETHFGVFLATVTWKLK